MKTETAEAGWFLAVIMQVIDPHIPPGMPLVQPGKAGTGPRESLVPDRMVRARLGPYAGLYHALKAKHPPAAAHCLRVAIGCSKWAGSCKMPEAVREVLEIAGLLHDIGKVGVPDSLLQKPESLNAEEQQTMDLKLHTGLQILTSVGASPLLVETIQHARHSFDSGVNQNPLARMLKIVDAFDSMTTVQVFRQALSKERAIDELFSHSGTQFDPDLVKGFVTLISQPQPELEEQVAQRWLTQLESTSNGQFQGLTVPDRGSPSSNAMNEHFHLRLLDALPDAAIYLDSQGKILQWNRAAEQLSGRTAESVLHCQWSPKLMGLMGDQGQPLDQSNCPLHQSLVTNTKFEASLIAVDSSERTRSIKMTAIPLFSTSATFEGFVLLVRDASVQSALEEKVQSLRAIASQDPLTKVANRAELHRRMGEFVLEHTATGVPGAVIMCDIDYFKRINDSFSHQAGDDALITFAKILSDNSRNQDLVARYGGEEFVILCDACDISAAHSQAEKIRRIVEVTPVPALSGQTMTSSFGVTQLQLGDDAETFLSRADRALMTAKETGRNRVVQLGAGRTYERAKTRGEQAESNQSAQHRGSWLDWFTGQRQPIRKVEYLSAVPIGIAIEKLQGFIRDHKADVLSTTSNSLSIQVRGGSSSRRRGEHAVPMILNMDIMEVQYFTHARNKVYQNRTKIAVKVHPVKARDRRRSNMDGQAHQLLLSFQAYIVGQEIDDELRMCIIEPR